MVNFRYHLTSLVAVFLALGLGMLVGASLADDEGLRLEQRAVIQEIEARLTDLRAENTQLGHQLSSQMATLQFYDEVLVQAGQAWIGDRLMGRRVTLFVSEAADEVTQPLRSFFESLGVQVTAIVWRGEEASAAGLGVPSQGLSAALADLLMGAEVRSDLEPLIAGGHIHFDGTLRPADAVVLIQSEIQELTAGVANQLSLLGVNGATATIGGAQATRISPPWQSVAHIDTPAGRLRLASMLATMMDTEME